MYGWALQSSELKETSYDCSAFASCPSVSRITDIGLNAADHRIWDLHAGIY